MLHDIVIKTLTFLVNDSRSQFGYLLINEVVRLGGERGWHCRGQRRLLAILHLVPSTGGTWPFLGLVWLWIEVGL